MCRKEAEGRKAQGTEETLKEGMETELMEWYPGCKEIKKVRVCSIQVKDVQTGTVKDEHRRERLERGIHWARLCLKPVFSPIRNTSSSRWRIHAIQMEVGMYTKERTGNASLIRKHRKYHFHYA